MDKSEFVLFAKQHFGQRLIELDSAIAEVQKAANTESKSSMGDKYETGRAMAHNDIFMLMQQKTELGRNLDLLNVIDFGKASKLINLGSLVKTPMGWFLLSSGLGKIVFQEEPIMCISPESPLGKELLGKSKADSFAVVKAKGEILEVF